MRLSHFSSLLLFILASFISTAQEPTISNDPSEIGIENDTKMTDMYYIYLKESKNHKEFFPKLYPIGFIVKEKSPNGKKTKYLLGEFSDRAEAEEALAIAISSGYNEAKIITKKI